MNSYVLTVFDKTGENLLDETFEAESHERAKEIGEKKIEEKGYEDHAFRCVSSDATLLLFHS